MILEKGKTYVLFGNFPNPQQLQEDMHKRLGIRVVCIMNNVDTTVAMEYRKQKRTFIERLFNI